MRNFIFFFGPPASGKGTQIELLQSYFGFKVLSIGKLLRRERDGEAELGAIIESYVSEGKLVPNEIVERVIDKELKGVGRKTNLIFDGYPRNEEQLRLLDCRFKSILDKGDRVYAIYINIGPKEIKRRLGGRRSCKCGATFHVEFNPPKKDGRCDECNKHLFIRTDDSYDVIQERIRIFKNEFKPIVRYWVARGVLMKINGERGIEAIQRNIRAELGVLGVVNERK